MLLVSGMEGDCRYSAGNQSVASLGTLDVVTDRPEGGAEDEGKSEGDMGGQALGLEGCELERGGL